VARKVRMAKTAKREVRTARMAKTAKVEVATLAK
jgi:hypothetical protein